MTDLLYFIDLILGEYKNESLVEFYLTTYRVKVTEKLPNNLSALEVIKVLCASILNNY